MSRISSPEAPSATQPHMPVKQLWLCLHLHRLALDLVERAWPQQQIQPEQAQSEHAYPALAVVSRQHVIAANDIALEHGVHAGISARLARTLLPDITLCDYDLAAQRQAIDMLAQHCYRFTPMTVAAAPDCVLLDIKSSLRLFGGLPALQADIAADIAALGFGVRYGLGHTPQCARLLSQHDDNDVLMQRYLQQDGFYTTDFLDPLQTLPLSVLMETAMPAPTRSQQSQGQWQKNIQKLQRMGWQTLGDVLAQPLSTLARGVDSTLITQLKKISGELPDPQTPIKLRNDFCSALSLPFACGSVQALLFPIKRLLRDMQQFLRRRQLASHAIQWTLRDTRRRIYTLDIAVAKPHCRADAFLTLTQLKLESLRLLDAIDTVTLTSCRHSALTPEDNTLLQAAPQQRGDISAVIDRLRARLGDDACIRFEAVDEHLPEQTTRAEPVDADNACAELLPTSLDAALDEPLWLLPTPQRLPRGLYYHGELALAGGALRTESYWWNTPVTRYYYHAQHDDGSRYWVFRQFPGGQWYLHGVFA